MFIQLPKQIRSLLEDSIVKGNSHNNVETTYPNNSLAVHVLVLKASQRNWAGYNHYLAECISELVRLLLQVDEVETDIYCSTISPHSPKSATRAGMTITLSFQAAKS